MEVPPDAVSIGHGAHEHERLYPARAMVSGSLVPGSCCRTADAVFVFGSTEHHVHQYEVLVGSAPGWAMEWRQWYTCPGIVAASVLSTV